MSELNRTPGEEALWKALNQLGQRLERLEQAMRAQVQPPPLPPHMPAKESAQPIPVEPEPQWQTVYEVKPDAPVDLGEPLPVEPVEETPQAEAVELFQSPHPAPPPLAAGRTVPTPPAEKRQSIEQRLGMRWLLIAGIAMTLLAAVFFFQYMVTKGWINEGVRLCIATAAAMTMLAIGEVALRRTMRLFAGGIWACGIVLLYMVTFVASPNSPLGPAYFKLGSTAAFACMCAVTLMGVGLAVRSGMLLSAIISMVGAMATPILLSTGENREVALMTYLLIIDAGFLILAIVKRWQALAPLAFAGTAIVFGGWFARYGGESSQFVTSMFGWGLFVLFVLHIMVGRQKNQSHPAVGMAMLLLGGTLMVALWLRMQCSGASLLTQLLILNLLLLAICMYNRWQYMVPLVMAGTIILMGIWLGQSGNSVVLTNTYGWIFFAVFTAYGLVSVRLGRAHPLTAPAFLGASGAFLTALWLGLNQLPSISILIQLAVLDVLVLGLCLVYRWNWPRCGAVIWTVFGIFLSSSGLPMVDHGTVITAMPLSVWICAFFALFSADLLIRAWWRESRTLEAMDGVLAGAVNALMFGSTYYLLREEHASWMGAYTAGLGLAALGLAWLVRRRADRRMLAYAYLSTGLILLALAIPIQFKKAAITLAWAIQSVVFMFAARRLKSYLITLASLAVLGLAIIHYFGLAMPYDPRLAETVFSPLGVSITQGLLLAMALTAACFADAAMLIRETSAPVYRDTAKRVAMFGVIIYGLQTVRFLPPLAATWWWMAMVLAVGAVAWWRRSSSVGVLTILLLPIVAGKWMLYDTLALRLMDKPADLTVACNWQFSAAILLTAIILVFVRRFIAGGLIESPTLAGMSCAAWRSMLTLLAALIVVWGGSFEIDRFFASQAAHEFAKPSQAMQMGYSLWWSLCAITVLISGFVWSKPVLRYFAIAIFAVTLGKVFLVDLYDVEAVYRILSFLALGILLVAASWFYNSYFRAAANAKAAESQDAPPPTNE